MNVKISVAAFKRLSVACANDKDDPNEKREFAFGVNLTRLADGNAVAVASNGKILACEYLGNEYSDAGSVTIRPIDEITMFDDGDITYAAGMLIIEQNGIPVAFPQNAIIDKPYVDWKKLIPRGSKKKSDKGTLSFEGQHIQRLARTTPLNSLIFPESFKAGEPIVVTTPDHDDWFGLFLPVTTEGQQYPHAKLPKWIN